MRKEPFLAFLLLLSIGALPVSAHEGRTDFQGGHYENSTGKYHYHHGYTAHHHPGGTCPYDSSIHTLTPFDHFAAFPDSSEPSSSFSVEANAISKYDDGYSDGYDEGHSDGYNEGLEQGTTEGYANGWNESYNAAQQEIEDFYFTKDDISEKYNEGYSEGEQEGFEKGRSEGIKTAEYAAEQRLKNERDKLFSCFLLIGLLFGYLIYLYTNHYYSKMVKDAYAATQRTNTALNCLRDTANADLQNLTAQLQQSEAALAFFTQKNEQLATQRENIRPILSPSDTYNENFGAYDVYAALPPAASTSELLDRLFLTVCDEEQQNRLARSESPEIEILSLSHENNHNVLAEISEDSGTIYQTSLISCTCPDFKFRHLPCKHMYALGIEILDRN